MVVGNDLRNEVRMDTKNFLVPDWGSGNFDTDWHWAATRAGNSILSIAPNQLIIVEAVNSGFRLSPIKQKTVVLDKPNKLVWSFHYYDFDQDIIVARKDTYENMRDDLDFNIAFCLEEGHDYTAPLWLGEFGTGNENDWWKFLIRYL